MYEFEDIIQILQIIENYFFHDQKYSYVPSSNVLTNFNNLDLSNNMSQLVELYIYDYSIVLNFDKDTEIEIYPRNINSENILEDCILDKFIIFPNIDLEIYKDIGVLDNTQMLITHYRNNMYNLSNKELILLDEIASIILGS